MIIYVQADPGGVSNLSPVIALGEVGGLEAGGGGQHLAVENVAPGGVEHADEELEQPVAGGGEQQLAVEDDQPGVAPWQRRATCEDCGREFTRRSGMENHMRRVHPQPGVSCKVCGKIFPRASSVNSHMGQAHGRGDHPCKPCKKRFDGAPELKLHNEVKHKNSTEALELKLDTEVSSKGGAYKCGECGEAFGDPTGVVDHIEAMHEPSGYTCSNCKYMFDKSRDMKNHMRQGCVPAGYSCDQCEKALGSDEELGKHKTATHPKVAINCDHCGEHITVGALSDLEALSEHMDTKHGEAVVACTRCPIELERWGGPEGLILHALEAHGHRCASCGIRFESEEKLQEHEETNHGAANAKLSEGADFCNECSFISHAARRTNRVTAMKRHKQMHAKRRAEEAEEDGSDEKRMRLEMAPVDQVN